ncbi:MAG: B12-binding domain-containing radical SAM protein [Candidatus Heimdallarchaeota archaeon]
MSPDITLVHPLFLNKDQMELRLKTPYFPLGLLYLAAVLRRHEYNVEIFDCTFRKGFEEFEDYLSRFSPFIVGIGSLITSRRNALQLAGQAHRYNAKVILGGPDPTAIPERYLYYRAEDGIFPVDFVISGEGEITLLELMNHYFQRGNSPDNLKKIPGLRLRAKNNRVVSTGDRSYISDLDSIPFPARDLVDLRPYKRIWRQTHGFWSLNIINTRGCPYNCSWCQRAVFGRQYRQRSPENSAEEILHIKKTYQPNQIRIVDDITGIDETWIFKWRDALFARDAIIPFECLSRVNFVKKSMLKALKDAGCQQIHFGAESGSQKVLDLMNKGITVNQIHEAVELCRQIGIKIYFYMMVGYPGENWSDLQLSAKLLKNALPDEFSTTIVYPLPGTKFYEQVKDRLKFDTHGIVNWDYTAENKMLFKKTKFDTLFYRWVIRWLYLEWREAKRHFTTGISKISTLSSLTRLWTTRAIVQLLSHLSNRATKHFHLKEGK